MGILLLLFCGGKARAEYAPYRHGDRLVSADSIMEKVVFFAPLYERIVDSYNAELYIKGHIHIRKQNRLMRYIPTLFRMRKGEKEYLMETYNELSFTAPDIYDQKVTATMGTRSPAMPTEKRFFQLTGSVKLRRTRFWNFSPCRNPERSLTTSKSPASTCARRK